MSESFLDRAKADGKVFVKTMNFVGKLSKLKLDIHAKKQERERLIKVIGEAVLDHFRESKAIDGKVLADALSEDLQAVQHVDEELAELEGMVDQAKVDLKSPGKPKTDSKQEPPEKDAD
jgi:hypothetical protein